MTLKRLEAQGQIEKIKVDRKHVASNLDRARRDIVTAKANLDIDEEWTYAIAYHAMLRAGRALMFASGYRPKGKDQHKTVVEFSAEMLGGEFKNLVNRFNRMRIKRHDFIYDTEKPIPRTEAVHSLESAEQFVKEITARIQGTASQKKLI
ncbi:MAG: HEPN domain-containing protein [Syntrophales bacterium]|nr:HEPN domain-containing protein [Syntrophales bacterium]MDD5531620.1 HEPN domain-containing protein [Syntrophales bacterium]